MSVVIPTHNRRAMVTEAVASVLAQSCGAAEIVVVDDGSTDDTTSALQSRFGSAIRVIRSANHGVAAARNRGVAATRSEWIAFLDSDDLWLRHKLRTQVDYLQTQPHLRMCHTEETWMRDGAGINQSKHHRKPSGDIFLASLQRCVVGPSTVLLRRDLFTANRGFDPGLTVCEDYDLWLRIARTTPVGLIDEPLVIKRAGHADQLSYSVWGMDRFRVAALARLLTEPLPPEQRAATIAVLTEKCRILAQGAERRGRPEHGRTYTELAAWAQSTSGEIWEKERGGRRRAGTGEMYE